MDVLALSTPVVVGFAACTEFGSYALVHPVIRRFPPTPHITVEQGLLRTFGRVMPPLMTCPSCSPSSTPRGQEARVAPGPCGGRPQAHWRPH